MADSFLTIIPQPFAFPATHPPIRAGRQQIVNGEFLEAGAGNGKFENRVVGPESACPRRRLEPGAALAFELMPALQCGRLFDFIGA